MSSGGFIVFVGEEEAAHWRIASVSTDAQPTPVEPASKPMAAALRQMGYRGEAVVLAIPASWCMAATINLTQVGPRDRKAMMYLLEEHLPLPAESVVADFVMCGREALAVCARLASVREAIAALESEGVTVGSVAPAALLAAQDLARGAEKTLLLSIAAGAGVNFIAVRDATAIAWTLAADERDAALQADVLSLEFDSTIDVRSLSSDAAEQAARRQARRVLEGRERAWGEMRHGPLAPPDRLRQYRRAFHAALAAAAVLLLACSGAMLWRAHQYDRKARANEAVLATEFRRAFPGWAVPTNVKTVIESERRKAAAMSDDAGGGKGGHRARSAVRTLHDVLVHLPADDRWAIQRMSFDDSSFEIEGSLRAPEALDRFAANVRRAGMNVAPPESHRGVGGLWSFTVRGGPSTASAVARTRQD